MTSNATALPIDALLAAFRSVLRPLARLAVASGLTYPRIDEVLREVLVDAASAAHSSLPPQRRVSRISTTLGLHRREVTRLSRREAEAPAAPPSHTTRLFLKWQSDPRFRDASGSLQSLPRVGDDLSFEKLAQQVTRDVHPRSLLGELCRLGLARHDEERDTVTLMVDAFVPRGDKARMLGFLGANVGDHFDAAVTNVLSDGREHFEQAIFADELSVESVRAFRETITRQWQALRAAAVPALETLIEVDRATGRTQDQRLRIGLFSWAGAMRAGTANAADAAAAAPASEAPAGGPPAGDARVPPDTAGLPPAGTPSASSGAEAQPRGRGTSSAAVRRGKRAGKDGSPVDSTGKSKRRDSSQ